MPAAPVAPDPKRASPTDELAAEYPERPETIVGLDTSIELEGLGENITIGSDSIDETTIIETGLQQILLGDIISSNMDPTTGDTINTEYATEFTTVAYATDTPSAIPAWYSQIQQDVISESGFGGIVLTAISVNSMYIDQDNGENDLKTENIVLYGHVNHPEDMSEPIISDDESSVGSEDVQTYIYPDPWLYDEAERVSLKTKFGFDGTIPPMASNTERNVARYHIQQEMSEIAGLLATGFSERQGIRKIAQRPDYGDNYEYIPDSEQMESTSLVQQIVKTSTPSTSVGTEPAEISADPEFVDSEFEEEIRPAPGESVPAPGTPGAH